MKPRHRGVAQSLVFIANNRTRPIQVKDLIRISAMSTRGLHKAFKTHTGRTPGKELEIARIEHSKKLILKRGLKSSKLAPLCGYRSANTFYVAFKRVVGMSPGDFWKQHSLRTLAPVKRISTRL
jgi:AraC-like DNA-binding protein